jgi:type II secretory pathway pseudopilin PulG
MQAGVRHHGKTTRSWLAPGDGKLSFTQSSRLHINCRPAPRLAVPIMQPIQRNQRRSVCGLRPRLPALCRARAFSMLELLIVFLIMGILTAVAAPTFFDSLLFHRVESAARRVKADLELARMQARLTSATQTVMFSNSTYTISNLKSLDSPNAAYNVDLKKEPYQLNSATANFNGNQSVTFDGYGIPSSGGTVVLATKAHQCTVTLNGTTGDVTFTSNHSGGRTAAVAGS